MNILFSIFGVLDQIIWSYIDLYIFLSIGAYFTIKSKFLQFKTILSPIRELKLIFDKENENNLGISPIRLYFTSIGGMIGIGNLVAVMATISFGGIGSLFWMWVAGFIGMIIKYSEIQLGMIYRVKHKDVYYGGFMYYLKDAFSSKVSRFIPVIVSIFLCIYGVEIVQFLVITDSFVNVFKIDKKYAVIILLSAVMISSLGGITRLSKICAFIMPPMIILYILLGLYVICINYETVPVMICDMFYDIYNINNIPAVIVSMHYGFSRAVYSGDIGIGYDSVVHSETKSNNYAIHPRVAFFSLLTDMLICTVSIVIVYLTGVVDYRDPNIRHSEYIPLSLSVYFGTEYANIFFILFIFIAGFSTIISFFVVGQKAAEFINKKYGRIIYIIYANIAFVVMAFQSQENAMLVMSVCSGFLVLINFIGIFKLRNKISF